MAQGMDGKQSMLLSRTPKERQDAWCIIALPC